MGEIEAAQLRRLAAELGGEIERLARTVEELDAAVQFVRDPKLERVALYAVAALIETFYTGVEKTMLRVAATFGETPEGAAWHRRLLESMALEVPKLRPPVLSTGTVQRLEPLLSFRHRFRNLYLFDLRPELVQELAEATPGVWRDARHDVEAFRTRLDQLADALEEPRDTGD
jgi:hypothetical protein